MPGMDLAGAGSRLISYIIDIIIVGLIVSVLGAILSIGASIDTANPLVQGFGGLISLAYFTYFFGNGQTLGMKAMKIKLIGIDGTYPIGYGKGFLRWLGMLISSMILALGYIWILIDKKNQGWHDKIAGTYVVND